MSLHLVEGTVIAGRYHLVSRLGRGGMGEVWLARHAALDIPCAVKVIHADAASSPEHRARFELEARAAAQVRGAHVVQVLDVGVCEETPFLVMEYLVGESLGPRLARFGVLDVRGTVSIVVQVARALARAHAVGLVHRDLKPANIFLCREDDGEIAKVLDFGIAKRIGVGLDGAADGPTIPGTVVGTPMYMSPEQARGTQAVDHRADLWALGVIAFRCLTGQLPFRSDTLGDLMVRLMVEPIPVPSRIAAVPAGFDAWWARAASRDPDQRFQSAKELADALQIAICRSGTLDPDQPPSAAPFLLVSRRTRPAGGGPCTPLIAVLTAPVVPTPSSGPGCPSLEGAS